MLSLSTFHSFERHPRETFSPAATSAIKTFFNPLATIRVMIRRELQSSRLKSGSMADNSIRTGDVITYMAMCSAIGVNLQRGMNFRLRDGYSVILMSLRSGAPCADRVEGEGRVLIYEGHDVSRSPGGPDPKRVDRQNELRMDC